MTFIDTVGVVGIILSAILHEVSSDYCSNGIYCSSNQYCCSNTCCTRPYNSFWNLWYFWFVMFIIMMSCCGMCSYAKRRQYYGQQHNQIIIPAGRGRMTNITATSYPVGVTAPPAGQMHQQPLPPQAYQSPPPYSEVTSKPDLYPAYQGPPGVQMPYPTQQYAYPPPAHYPQQHMYPANYHPQASAVHPPVAQTPNVGSQPPPYGAEPVPAAAPPASNESGTVPPS